MSKAHSIPHHRNFFRKKNIDLELLRTFLCQNGVCMHEIISFPSRVCEATRANFDSHDRLGFEIDKNGKVMVL